MPNIADTLPHDILNENSLDIQDLIEGDVHYYRLVWDPTSRTVSVFNISGTSPLHIILIRKNIGHCEMFFLRLKGILQFNSMIACVGELSATNLKQNCKWVNNSNTLNINQGNIYGMPGDCGPWYLTIYTPGISNNTELSVEVSEPYDPLAFRWFRVTSNLAFVPAIYLALKRRFHAEAIIYVLTCTMSSVSSTLLLLLCSLNFAFTMSNYNVQVSSGITFELRSPQEEEKSRAVPTIKVAQFFCNDDNTLFTCTTRSYYRKKTAASPPRDAEGRMQNLLNKGLFNYMILLCQDEM
jgi:hypothetical protein